MRHRTLVAIALTLLATSPASAQVVRGVMTVTGAEMHGGAGVARGATARLYDVDHDLLKFVKFRLTKKYDQGTISFRARKGRLVSLDKLHESIWATRLSGGTRSGVICLDVTAMGVVVESEDGIILTVNGTDRQFVLVNDVKAKPVDAKKSMLAELREVLSDGQTTVSVSGYVDGWVGRWPDVLRQPPARRPQLMVTGFTSVGKGEAMKQKGKVSSVLGATLGAAATVPNGTAAATLSLLGLAGGTAAKWVSWLAPVFIVLAAALLVRAHYLLYVRKRGTRLTTVVTWLATVFVVGFWTWQWTT